MKGIRLINWFTKNDTSGGPGDGHTFSSAHLFSFVDANIACDQDTSHLSSRPSTHFHHAS